ncbi:XRE family transcriptional regulator [Arthrobacter sp. G.S.26]|uniref:XRE family transcriptional regulator n=1 Tax=Arthrobacter sp. G.S.26 TaxID=3433706 RepID=UPI003D782A6A
MEQAARHETEPLLGRVRVARGLTQSALAKKAGISQGLLSKAESGLVELDVDRARSLAEVLQVPLAALTVPVTALSSSIVFHRKRATMPVSKANQVRAALDMAHIQVSAIMGHRRPPLRIVRTPLPEDGYTTPEDLAKSLRQQLAPGSGPVESVVSTLEDAGVPVLVRDFDSTLIDAIFSWPADAHPLVILASHAPADRQRFTLAHELGHAVMHQVPSETQEAEADRFASEFLMPAKGIRDELGEVTVPSLARLKPAWRVSMAALLRRARDLGQITESKYKTLSIEMSAAGYRKNEPVSIAPEEPTLIQQTIAHRLAAGETIDALASEAYMTTEEFHTTYGGPLQ